MTVEYRVRPVTKYIVTRYESTGDTGKSETRGQYENGEIAYQVAFALCRMEHGLAGTPMDDAGFVYPGIPQGVSVPPDTHPPLSIDDATQSG